MAYNGVFAPQVDASEILLRKLMISGRAEIPMSFELVNGDFGGDREPLAF